METLRNYIKTTTYCTGDAQELIQDTVLTGPEAICSDSSGKKRSVLSNVLRELTQTKQGGASSEK